MSASNRAIHAVADGEYRFGTSGTGTANERCSVLATARDRFESIDDLRCAAWCTLDMGIIKGTELGDLHGAEMLFEQARDGLTECQEWRGVGLAIAKLSNLAVVRGDVARARRQLESFNDHIAVIDATASASIARAWSDVHQAEGNWGASITELRRAVSYYERATLTHELLGARVELGATLVACRRTDEAPGPGRSRRALGGLASCLAQSGDIPEAFAIANEAVEIDARSTGHGLITRVERCSAALSLARQLTNRDAIDRLLPKLIALLEQVYDPKRVAQAIYEAVDALLAIGNELAARRLQALLTPG
jgi:tetratricopeptide (TPR) repeat protein